MRVPHKQYHLTPPCIREALFYGTDSSFIFFQLCLLPCLLSFNVSVSKTQMQTVYKHVINYTVNTMIWQIIIRGKKNKTCTGILWNQQKSKAISVQLTWIYAGLLIYLFIFGKSNARITTLWHHMEVCLDAITTANNAGCSRRIKIRVSGFHLLLGTMLPSQNLFIYLFCFYDIPSIYWPQLFLNFFFWSHSFNLTPLTFLKLIL